MDSQWKGGRDKEAMDIHTGDKYAKILVASIV